MLDNINRTSSKPGASRKGLRQRKSNNQIQNQASHSQDLRPSLPEVQTNKPGALSKLTYNKLTDLKTSNNSASTADLHSIMKNASGNSLAQSQKNAPNSLSSQNLHHPTNSSHHGGNQTNIPISQKYQSQREKLASANHNRRGGLFKVNTQSHLTQASGHGHG